MRVTGSEEAAKRIGKDTFRSCREYAGHAAGGLDIAAPQRLAHLVDPIGILQAEIRRPSRVRVNQLDLHLRQHSRDTIHHCCAIHMPFELFYGGESIPHVDGGHDLSIRLWLYERSPSRLSFCS